MKFLKILMVASVLITFYASICNCKPLGDGLELDDDTPPELNSNVISEPVNLRRMVRPKDAKRDAEGPNKNVEAIDLQPVVRKQVDTNDNVPREKKNTDNQNGGNEAQPKEAVPQESKTDVVQAPAVRSDSIDPQQTVIKSSDPVQPKSNAPAESQPDPQSADVNDKVPRDNEARPKEAVPQESQQVSAEASAIMSDPIEPQRTVNKPVGDTNDNVPRDKKSVDKPDDKETQSKEVVPNEIKTDNAQAPAVISESIDSQQTVIKPAAELVDSIVPMDKKNAESQNNKEVQPKQVVPQESQLPQDNAQASAVVSEPNDRQQTVNQPATDTNDNVPREKKSPDPVDIAQSKSIVSTASQSDLQSVDVDDKVPRDKKSADNQNDNEAQAKEAVPQGSKTDVVQAPAVRSDSIDPQQIVIKPADPIEVAQAKVNAPAETLSDPQPADVDDKVPRDKKSPIPQETVQLKEAISNEGSSVQLSEAKKSADANGMNSNELPQAVQEPADTNHNAPRDKKSPDPQNTVQAVSNEGSSVLLPVSNALPETNADTNDNAPRDKKSPDPPKALQEKETVMGERSYDHLLDPYIMPETIDLQRTARKPADLKVEEVPTILKSLNEHNVAHLENSILNEGGLLDINNKRRAAPAPAVTAPPTPDDIDDTKLDELDDLDLTNGKPEPLPDAIKPEEPFLHGQTEDSNVVPLGKRLQITKNDLHKPQPPLPEEEKPRPFALFTIANTDIGAKFDTLPYREKYQWQDPKAPCHTFDLKIPDELAEKSVLKLCIFRPNLEFPDETNLFLLNTNVGEKDYLRNIMGNVVNSPGSTVYGRIQEGRFYGEVSVIDPDKNLPTIFVIEDINLLNRLMRYNPKTLKHMLMVMHVVEHNKGNGKKDTYDRNDQLVYNAVVTKGASLINFMMYTNDMDVNRNPFLMFSTSHNSYISSGEPTMQVDEHGEVKLESGNNKIQVMNDGSIKIDIVDKEYTFRPNGRTIVKEGMEVRTLQEHEGSVAITAYSSSSTYDCVLPTPAFQPTRRGGYVCKVCIAMDDIFKKNYIGNLEGMNDTDLAQVYLGRIIDRVSWIFRSMDFDGDAKPENIGLDYETHSLRWSYPDIGGEDVTEQDIEVLFQSLEAYNFADCCLGIGFTMKNFPKDVQGKRTEGKAGPSGVCAGRTGRSANNLIIISANSKQGNYSQLNEDQLIYATANQIAGAFGASPDGTGNDVCDQFVDHEDTRHYLMWPEVTRNTTLAEQTLSTCSKDDVMKVLTTCRSSCFDIDLHPFCGNGIVEEGEECDCGSQHNCASQTCCYSRIGQHPCRKSGIGCTSGSTALSPAGLVPFMGILILTGLRHLLVS